MLFIFVSTFCLISSSHAARIKNLNLQNSPPNPYPIDPWVTGEHSKGYDISLSTERCYTIFAKTQITGSRNHLKILGVKSSGDCRLECEKYKEECRAFTFWTDTKTCWLRRNLSELLDYPVAFTAAVEPCQSSGRSGRNTLPYPPQICVDRYEGFDSPGKDIVVINSVPDEEACVRKCNIHSSCTAYTYQTLHESETENRTRCHLRTELQNELQPNSSSISGILKTCGEDFTTNVQLKSNLRLIDDIHAVFHEINTADSCWKICSFESNCEAAEHRGASTICILKSKRPTGSLSHDSASSVAIKLTGKFDFYQYKELDNSSHSLESLKSVKLATVWDCEKTCLNIDQCGLYFYHPETQNCRLQRLVRREFDEAELVSNNSTELVMGVRSTARFCWNRFPGYRSPDLKSLLRIVNLVSSELNCQNRCKEFGPQCRAYTYFSAFLSCWLKSSLASSGLSTSSNGVSAKFSPCEKRPNAEMHMQMERSVDGNLLDAFSSSSSEECWRKCDASIRCGGFNFIPLHSTCFLLSKPSNQNFSPEGNTEAGFKTTGSFNVYKRKRLEGIREKRIRVIVDVHHLRACEEFCLAEKGCEAYNYGCLEQTCTIFRDVEDETYLHNYGAAYAGIMKSRIKGSHISEEL